MAFHEVLKRTCRGVFVFTSYAQTSYLGSGVVCSLIVNHNQETLRLSLSLSLCECAHTQQMFLLSLSACCCFFVRKRKTIRKQVLAVALGQAVYLWNAATGSIEHLLTLPDPHDFVTRYSSILLLLLYTTFSLGGVAVFAFRWR